MQLSLVRMWSTIKKFTNMDLNSEFQNIRQLWNDHDQGVKQWSVINSIVFSTPPAAIPTTGIGSSQMQIWVDQTGNNLTFQVKYSNGTVKNGTVALS